MDQNELDRLTRNELIQRARRLGVERAELMTRVELRDEIVRLSETDVVRRKRARGWLGVARDLLASVVDKRLNLPEAAALIRGDLGFDFAAKPHRPVATVTLAEIYAAQGHVTRAVELLDEVLAGEPDHEAARELRDRLEGELERRAATAALRSEQRSSGGALGRSPLGAPADERLPEVPSDEEALEAEAEPELAESKAERAEPEAERAEPEPERAEPVALPAEIDSGWEPAVSALGADVDVSPRPAPSAVPEPSHDNAAGADLLVAIPRGPSGTFVYWELRPESVERARRRQPGGRTTVRVVALEPCWDGAKRSEREIDAEPLIGSAMLDGFGGTAVVRAVLGWRSLAGFRPLEVGIVLLESASADQGEQMLEVQWAPPGRRDGTMSLELARSRLLDCLQAH